MNGAESLLRTLVNGGVEVCFMNPGTSEMHFVAAADRVPDMRCVLGLFEGVVSGAADGYARMADRPAATLLHCGPGLGNALANLHNARRARVPVVNIVGDIATHHRAYDAPLQSDIAAIAGAVSGWVREVRDAMEIPEAAHAAIGESLRPPGQIATLIVPADCAWNESTEPFTDPVIVPEPERSADAQIREAAAALRSGRPAALLISGLALRERGLALASRIAQASGARLWCDTFNTRHERGAGRVAIAPLSYFPERAQEALQNLEHLVVAGTRAPVGFFAYPGVRGTIAPPDCAIHVLASPEADGLDALERLVAELGAEKFEPIPQPLERPDLSRGALTPEAIARALAVLLPEDAVVVDEAITGGSALLSMTATAAPHDWLSITGGAIGQALPVAVGAAIAAPDRSVICLESDGSAMYTLQSLWTQARESLNVTNVIFSNAEYRILSIEHQRVGAGKPGPKARELFSLRAPDLDWVRLALGMGVPARRATTAEEFIRALAEFLKEPGPGLIEAVID
ncbi:MAG: acetolactate synthase large subunit [Gammaproteobacteria bacterium]|nr:acetolactate synthase large subunit [Gammaproteobacteria bacterium]